MKRHIKIATALVVLLALGVFVLHSNPRIPLSSSTILQKSSELGYTPIVAIQMSLGVSPDGPDRTPLIQAIMDNRPQIAELAISHGADLEREFKSGAPEGPPLAWALRFGRKSIAKSLLQHGAHTDYKATFCGYGLLHMAVELEDAQLVRLLIRKGADPNASTYSGVTPLHLAAAYGREEIARVLIKAGADTSARTNRADTEHYCYYEHRRVPQLSIPAHAAPLDVAIARKDNGMIKLLSSHESTNSRQ